MVPDESIPLEERVPADVSAVLTPSVEGQGAVRVCARRNPDVCGRASFFVDNGPPVSELTAPLEDEIFIGEGDPTVLVEGTVSGQVALYVNEEEVTADDTGAFSVTLPLRFGYNTIAVAADDGFRRPLTRVLRTVLYAPTTLPIEGSHLDLPTPLTLRIPPELLDGEAPAEPPLGELPTFTDLAHSLSFVLGLIDPSSLVDTNVNGGDTVSARITEASLGVPEINFIVQDGLIEAFVSLPNLSVSTAGLFDFQGVELSLEGVLDIAISSFISLRPEVVNGEIILVPGDSGIAIENIRGVMTDPVSQALLDTLTSAFRLAVSGWADQLVTELIETELPNALNGQVDSLMGLVSQIDLDLSDDEFGVMINSQLSFSLPEQGALEVSARDGVSIRLNIAVDGQPFPMQGLHQELPEALTGVPAHPIREIPWPANDEVGLALPLAALNAALYQVWVQGAFSLDLGGFVPPPFDRLLGGVQLKAIRPPLFVDTPVGDPAALALSMEGLILYIDSPQQTDPPDESLRDEYRMSIYFPLSLGLEEGAEGPQVSFILPGSPSVRVGLSKVGGARPVVEPALIERSIGNLVLPQLEDLLQGGLSLPLPSAVVDLVALLGGERLSLQAQRVIYPRLTELLRVDNGWVVISSGLGISPLRASSSISRRARSAQRQLVHVELSGDFSFEVHALCFDLGALV